MYFRRLWSAHHLPWTSACIPARIGAPLSVGRGCLSPPCTDVSQEGEGMRNDLSSWASIATLALFLLPATLAASAQTAPPDRPSTDAEKIADALRAGPRFITTDATLVDWPTTLTGNIACFARGPMNGRACRASRAIRTTNRDASIQPSCNG